MPHSFRYSLRMLARQPAASLLTIGILALGIAATTAAFSVANSALFRPFPFLDTNRWAYLYEKPSNTGLSRLSVSIPNYRDWKEQSKTFADMGLWLAWNYNLSGGDGDPERVPAIILTPTLFTSLNLVPAAGRLLLPSDGPTSERPIMISHALWTRRFGASPAIIGSKIQLNLIPHTVIGVAPQGFVFPPESPADIWTPQSAQLIATDQHRDARGLKVAGFLKPGVSFAAAQSEMNGIAARLAAQYRENTGFGVDVLPVRDTITEGIRTPLLTLSAALAFVILLVCVNIANLQIVKLERRKREFAVRAAIGGTTQALITQLVLESALLCIAAGLIGTMLVPICIKAILSLVPPQRMPWINVTTDINVLLISAAITLAVTLITGVIPALRIGGIDIFQSLTRAGSAGTSGSASRTLRYAFLTTQLALCLMLLVGAGLLIQSFLRLRLVNPGFSPERTVTLSFSAPRARYTSAAQVAALGDKVAEGTSRIPGIVAAGTAQALPFGDNAIWFQPLTRKDPRSIPNIAELPYVHYNVVSTGYGEALGASLQKGRFFSAADHSKSEPVVIINRALARQFLPDEDPIGKMLWVGDVRVLPNPRKVVGVIGDTLWRNLEAPPEPEAWVPLSQQSVGEDVFRRLSVVVRSNIEPTSQIAAIRSQIRQIDKDLALTSVQTLDALMQNTIWRQRLAASTLAALGLAGLLVASLGVFAVVSFLVGRRTHEIGVRMALGCGPHEIVRLVISENVRTIIAGIAAGLLLAAALSRYLASLLYGVESTDLRTFAASAFTLAVTALLACYFPARRASRVDPLTALRSE